MPSDTFTNPNLTDNDVLAIQGSADDVLVLAQRFDLLPIEVKAIRDARAGTAGQPITLGSSAVGPVPASGAGPFPPKIGSG